MRADWLTYAIYVLFGVAILKAAFYLHDILLEILSK